MIKLKCQIEGERTVVLDYCGRKILKNGTTFEIKTEDLYQPEIQYLIKREILISNDNTQPDQKLGTEQTHLYKCLLSKERRLAFDSIKGSVQGQGLIEIKTSAMNNQDVSNALSNKWIELFVKREEPTEEETVKEEAIEKSTDSPFVDMDEQFARKDASKEAFIDNKKADEEDEEKSEDFVEIKIEDIKTKEAKTEPPKFRANEDIQEKLKEIAKNIYAENEEPKIETKKAPLKTRKSSGETTTAKKTSRKKPAAKTTVRKQTVKKAE